MNALGLGMGMAGRSKRLLLIDSDAARFFLAAEITEPTQQKAVNQLVVDLKAGGLWSKLEALYPFVGGAAAPHSYNLKNPAQYQIAWTGTVHHDDMGIIGDGVSGFGDTGFAASTPAIVFGSYFRAMGTTGLPMCFGNSATDGIAFDYTGLGFYCGVVTFFTFDSLTGLCSVNCVSGILGNVYRDGVVDSEQTTRTFNPPSLSLHLLNASEGGACNDANIAFSFVTTTSLTGADHAALYTIVQSFETRLERQV